MTPQISEQIRQELQAHEGVPVRVVDAATNRIYYVVAAEQYEALRALLDDGEFSPRDAYPLISKTAAEAGWDDPLMDAYDNYDQHRHES